MNIETLIDVAIEDEFNKFSEIKEAGTEQGKTVVDGITKLLDRKLEMEKLEIERHDKEENRRIDAELKMKQMKDERTDRIVKNCITGVSVVGGLALTVWGAIMSWKFEENGTITSTAGRKFMGNLFFKK